MKKGIRVLVTLLILMVILTGAVYAADTVQRGGKLAMFRDMAVPEKTTLIGDLVGLFGDIEVDGKVDGDVIAIFGSITLEGTVDGDAVSIFGRVDMGDEAMITGDKVQIIGGSPSRPRTAKVLGDEMDIIYFENVVPGIGGLMLFILILTTIKGLISFMFSLLLIVIAPERMDKIADSVRVKLGRDFGIGLLILVGYYIVAALGAMIVIGIPILALAAPAMFLLGFTGNTAIKLALGKRVGKERKWSQITQLFIGSLIYWVLDLTIILKPILYLAKVVGIGAVIDTKLGTVSYWGEKEDMATPAYQVADIKVKNPEPQEDKEEIESLNEENKDDTINKDEE